MHPIVPAEWGARELVAAMRAFVSPWRANAREARLAAELGRFLGGATVLPINAGRNALRLALETFRARRPDRELVLVPDYVCASVIDAVVAAGCRPAPVPVGSDLNLALEPLAAAAADPATLAIVAVHMYGAPADVAAIEALGRRTGVFVVDDAAQVLGVRVGDRPLGTFGDAGVLSFAQSKTVTTGVRGSGGALVVRDAGLARELQERIASWPRARGRWRHRIAFALSLGRGRLSQGLAWRLGRASQDDYAPRRIDGTDAAVASAQLTSLEERVAGRIGVAGAFTAALSEIPGVRMPQAREGRYLTRVLVELPPTADRTRVRKALAQRGIQTRLPYDLSPIEPFGNPAAVAARLLELPSRSRMEVADVTTVCTALADAIEIATADLVEDRS